MTLIGKSFLLSFLTFGVRDLALCKHNLFTIYIYYLLPEKLCLTL
jgi:hypothetical protein